jgi:hypothetical protein
MGRPRRLNAGSDKAGVALEYVRSRKLLRVLGWVQDEPIGAVEIPVEELCAALGIDPRDVGSRSSYLLFAGSHSHPAGGLRDLVGTFTAEDKAWAAFRALREGHPATQGWAELAVVDGLGQVHQLAWFGLHPAVDAPVVAMPQPARPRLPRPAGSERSTAYLRAVTPS